MANRTFILTTPDGRTRRIMLRGRNAWLAKRLIEASGAGLSAMECPAGLRLAANVFNLRRAGVPVVTTTEAHGGAFPGWHARYRLNPSAKLEADAEGAP